MASIYGVNFDAVAFEKTPKILKTLYQRQGRFLKHVKVDTTRIDAGGKYARIPLHTGGNVNDGARRADMTGNARLMPNWGDGQQYAEGRMDITNFYMSHYLDRAKVDALKNNKDGLITLIADEMDKGMKDAVKQVNRMLHRDGTGILAEIVSDANSATHSVAMAGASLKTSGVATTAADYINGLPIQHFRARKKYSVIKYSGGVFSFVAPTATYDDYITAESIDAANLTVTFSAAIDTSAAGDRFFIAEHGNVVCTGAATFQSSEPIGIMGLVNNGNIIIRGAADISGIFPASGDINRNYVCNINASNSYWQSKGNYASSLRDFSEFDLIGQIQEMDFEGVEDFEKFMLMLNPVTLKKVGAILEDDTQKIFYETLDGGWQVGKFNGMGIDVKFLPDWDAALHTIRGFDFNNLILASIMAEILSWDNADGSVWTTGKINRMDAIMAMIYARYNMGITARNFSFVYNSLDPSVTP